MCRVVNEIENRGIDRGIDIAASVVLAFRSNGSVSETAKMNNLSEDVLPQFVRTAQKEPPEQEILSFKRSGAASAAPLQSLAGYAHGCKNECSGQSYYLLL